MRKIAIILVLFYLVSFGGEILLASEYIIENPSIITDPPKDAWLAKKYTAYNQGGKNISSYTNYIYDKNDLLIERSGVGRQVYKNKYVYDKNKLLKQEISNIDEMSVVFITNYYYNNKNELIRTEWGEENKIDFVIKYSYNKAGKIIKVGKYSNKIKESEEKYYYNSNNMLEKIEFIYGKQSKVISTRYYKYDDKAYLIETYMISETAEEFTKYKYNKNMKLHEKILLSKAKTLIKKAKYKYDNQKKLKEIKTYDARNELMFVEQYEY